MSQKRRLSFSDDDADNFDWDAHNANAHAMAAAESNAAARRLVMDTDDNDDEDEDWTLLIDSESAGTEWERDISNQTAEALMVTRWFDTTPYGASLYRDYEEEFGERPDGAYLKHKTTGEIRRLPTRANTWMIWLNGNHESDMRLENVQLLLDGDEELNNQFHEFVQAYSDATGERVDSIELTRDDERIEIDADSVMFDEAPANTTPTTGMAALVAATGNALDDVVEFMNSRLRGPPDQA